MQNKAVDKLRDISIHALRGEGDFQALVSQLPPRYFNPRPPWGGRQYDLLSSDLSMRFQSTPSVGRATSRCSPPPLLVWYFNPRPPWGGRRCRKHQLVLSRTISIHALRGEGDVCPMLVLIKRGISIHALRGEGDASCSAPLLQKCFYFNPRPPWGGRLG